MLEVLCVGAGGAAGAICRYAAGLCCRDWVNGFPAGTLLVNLAGCFLIGVLGEILVKDSHHHWRLLLLTGFCGGFTTFSTFTAEFMHQVHSGDWRSALLYAGISFFGGLGVFVAGLRLGKLI